MILRALLLACLLASFNVYGYQPKAGDIVFHTSLSAQSLAIQQATRSPYSHVGVVLLRNGHPYVFEAVQPVKYTLFSAWVSRGGAGHFSRRPV